MGRHEIVNSFQRTADHLRVLEFLAEDGATQTISTTDEHPFWSVGAGDFVAAGDLRIGDRFISPAGEFSTLIATHREQHPEGVPVYNFEVSSVHNYYVRAHGLRGPPLRVHNATELSCLLGGARSSVPDSYMNPRHYVDMEPARNPPGSTLNASRKVRNASFFWEELVERYPKMFSKGNRYRIQELRRSPKVDRTWIEHNPTHESFIGDVLHHHHIDHGRIAAPLPKTIHERWTFIIH